ncbi:hypothetical protein B296_00048590 [Ensete ventricosum]|uniref:Uncharacterized protein n=1 Tax=Ensete ventricosum TaxID=4639 RepID=A0A426YU35_ENSVE|nr:hypothetical protein B296_00048590 [Ensete ventricosum]
MDQCPRSYILSHASFPSHINSLSRTKPPEIVKEDVDVLAHTNHSRSWRTVSTSWMVLIMQDRGRRCRTSCSWDSPGLTIEHLNSPHAMIPRPAPWKPKRLFPQGGQALLSSFCGAPKRNRRWTPRMDDGEVRLLFLYTRQKRNDNDECLVSVLAERDSKPLPPDSPTPSELCSLFLLWPSFAI